MRPAVEFEQLDTTLVLLYTPRDDDSWVYDRFERGEELVIKGTFHLRRGHLVSDRLLDTPDDETAFVDSEPLRFRVAGLEGEYFSFDSEILPIG